MQIMPLDIAAEWIPSRAQAVERLLAFSPQAGRTYAAQRNYDRGPADRTNVSTLSPYLRARVLTEAEAVQAVLGRHSVAGAQKFVQEIFWRTYWKGWLEAHPDAWTRYRSALDDRLAELAASPPRNAAYADAIAGRTGIDAFDNWARELVRHAYLHNHARMWFASIWIFTLGLPWELGADFFMRNLLDGDPASNTLSWRWVAGLHTRGRSYLATRANIARYTDGRFAPSAALARSAPPLDDAPIPQVAQRAVPRVGDLAAPSLLVLHEDDLHGDLLELPAGPIRGVCAIQTVAGRSSQPVNPAVVDFSDALAREAVERCGGHCAALDLGLIRASSGADRGAAVAAAAATCGATQIVAPFAPIGPARAAIDELRGGSADAGLGYVEFGRRYDAVSWPAATRGFFNLRSRIPTILAELGIGAG